MEFIEAILCNEDLLTMILLRVPAKPVTRFKCVSKQWLFIISGPKFCYNHTLQNAYTSSKSGVYLIFHYGLCIRAMKAISLYSSATSLPSFEFLVDPLTVHTAVIHFCNGLMLWLKKSYCDVKFFICNPPIRIQDYKVNFIVANPMTREYKELPKHEVADSHLVLHPCLAFDPSKSPHYKVVYVWYTSPATSYIIDIYSSITKCWKRVLINEVPSVGRPSNKRSCCGGAVYWCGAVYWLNVKTLCFKFEIDDERLTSFPLPPNRPFSLETSVLYFRDCGDQFCLILSTIEHFMDFEVFEMERNQCRWTLKYKVELRFSKDVSPHEKCHFLVLDAVKTEDSDALVLVVSPGNLVHYDLKSKKMDIISRTSLRDRDVSIYRYAQTSPYIENLTPV